MYKQGFLRRFRDPIRVPRISNRVPGLRENYHRVPKIRKDRGPRIREIGSLQTHTGYLTFSLKKTLVQTMLFSAMIILLCSKTRSNIFHIPFKQLAGAKRELISREVE